MPNIVEMTGIRRFTNGFVSVLRVQDGAKLETTSTCLPISTEIRLTGKTDNRVEVNYPVMDFWDEKFCVGVSTQSGCPVKCQFCAVNSLTEREGWRNLTADEIVAQVDFAVNETMKLTNRITSPLDSQVFRILYTRMGEPALNINNVVSSIRTLKARYPHARIQISTIGLKKSAELVDALIELDKEFNDEWLELQFSIHSSDMEFRRWLQTDAVLDNKAINAIAQKYYLSKPNRKWKVTLNFALAENTPFDTEVLRRDFDPEVVFVKVSPINSNPVSESNNLKSLFEYHNSI